MNKDDSNLCDEPWILEVIEALKKEYDEDSRRYLTWMPKLIETLTKAETLLQTYQKAALEASYLPSHVKYRFGKQDSRYSLCGFFSMLISMCRQITANYMELLSLAKEGGAVLNEETLMRSIIDGKTTKHHRLVTAAGDKLTVIDLAMNCLMSRLDLLVQSLGQNPLDLHITIQFQKIYRNLYALAAVSDGAVSNILSRAGGVDGGDKKKEAIAGKSKLDEAKKIWKSQDPKEKRSERVRQLGEQMGIKDRTARLYAQRCESA